MEARYFILKVAAVVVVVQRRVCWDLHGFGATDKESKGNVCTS